MTAALKSLIYRPHAEKPEETKNGLVYFDGKPKEYHYWVFKTELKTATTKEEDFAKMVGWLVESLRGDALDIAMRIGVDDLIKPDKSGVKKLIEDVEKHIFPLAKEEAKTLFKEGQREGGGRSRQG